MGAQHFHYAIHFPEMEFSVPIFFPFVYEIFQTGRFSDNFHTTTNLEEAIEPLLDPASL